MAALYPMSAAAEDFTVGDTVRKWVTESNVTPFVGVVVGIHPSIYKVDVEWPVGNTREAPEDLIKINPIFGLPTVKNDSGYDSYDKSVSEKLFGKIPKRMNASDKMSIRIAHSFATKVTGKLIDEVVNCHSEDMTDIQAYCKIYPKFSSICSDSFIKSTITKIYKGE